MAIFDKAKEKFQGFMQGGEQANRNRRSNGGTSGYRPVRNQNTPQPQQEVPAGAFGGGVMPDTMFGGNAGFESVAATGRQNPSGAAPQQTAKHRSFQDLLNRALGKQDKQSGTQRQQPVQPPQQTGNVPYGQGQRFPNNGQNAQGGGNAMNSQNPYNNPQYGMGQRFPNAQNTQSTNAQYNNPQYGTSQRFQSAQFAPQGQPMGASQRYNTGYNQQLNGQLGYTGYQPQGSMGGQTGYHNPPQNYANPPRGNTMSGQPVQGTPVGGQTGYQQPYGTNQPYQQPTGQMNRTQQNAPEQVRGNVSYFPGSFVEEDGTSYRAVLNVVQVTSVSSCYRLIEFLQNNEILLVNAEDISDRMEARRCLDILYGACVVSKCRLTRVSRDTLYIIAPADVKLAAFDGLRRMGERRIHVVFRRRTGQLPHRRGLSERSLREVHSMIALKILDMLLRLYMLIVLAVVIIRVLQVTPNKWTNLLDRMTEPLLSPIRAQLNKHLPESWNAVDLSPLVLLLLVWLVRAILL